MFQATERSPAYQHQQQHQHLYGNATYFAKIIQLKSNHSEDKKKRSGKCRNLVLVCFGLVCS